MIQTYQLENGLTVVSERLPHLHSASIGIWVKAGSMLEKPSENGLSHLMEHMSFKGTKKRSARQLAEQMDAIGGQVNAATSKVCTTYYAKVTEQDVPAAIDLLGDIVRAPLLAANDLEKEKNVVLEEIFMVDDTPEDVADDLISEAMYGRQSLSRPILGSQDAIKAYRRQSLLSFRRRHYHPANMVVAVAGKFDAPQLRSLVEEAFASWQAGDAIQYSPQQANQTPARLARDKQSEQMQLCIGYRGIPSDHEDTYVMLVFNSIFGGGMSSRLFQHIREEHGLVYNIYSAPSAYPTCGDFVIYAGASAANAKRVLAMIGDETKRFLDDGITGMELQQAKAQLKTSFVLAQESAYQRMMSLGANMLIHHKIVRPQHVLQKIDQVSADDVLRLSRGILTGPRSMAVVGKKAAKYLAD